MSKEELLKKWAPILESIGVTNSHWGNIAQLAENQSNQILEENTSATENIPTLLPTAMKVAGKTLSLDLSFASQEEIDSVKKRVLSENRDGKISSIVDSEEFTEKKLEDDEEYKELMKKGVKPMSSPMGQLFYIDYKYGGDKDV